MRASAAGNGGAVEGGGGGVEQRELAAGLEVGEVDEQVGALGRREHEAVRRHARRGAEQAVVGADLGDPLEIGLAVAEQHEPVGAGVGAVDHAEAVGGGLHVEHRPDLAVDGRERREGLHHVGVGLVHELAGQPALRRRGRSCGPGSAAAPRTAVPRAGRARARARRGRSRARRARRTRRTWSRP